MENIHHRFSSNLCRKCGGPAPDWRCPACGMIAATFDARHALGCPKGGRMEAKCQRCGEAESKCTCV